MLILIRESETRWQGVTQLLFLCSSFLTYCLPTCLMRQLLDAIAWIPFCRW